MTTTHPYTVPIISGDLRRAELVKQCADTFDYLDSVSQDMFNRIATRLNIYRAQLNKFDERIQHANAHIDRIKGSKRAIQVHSSARYPVEQNRSTYTSIFECETENEESKPPVLHYNPFGLIETVDKFIDPNDKDSKSNNDTLIVLKQYEENFIQKTKRNVLHGLGRPPKNIQSVISFLKYNTQENPYTQPTKIDPLNVSGRIRKQADEPMQPRIVETPLPAFYKQMSERPTTGDIGYNPTLGSVPILSLPDNLPELDNYATFDDNAAVDWTKQQMSSIAPSFAISMLPDIGDLSTTTTTTTEATVTVEPPKTSVPAPPPVNMPAIIPLTSAATSVPPPAPPLPTPLPPSVSSLPSTLPSVLTPTSAADESQVPAEETADDDDGNPLLAQIRNFGKTNKLKSASKSNRVDEAPLPSSHEQESIMDSLKKRLQHRRGFITGETSAASSSNASAEKSLAAPPPLPSTGGSFTDAIAIKAREIADEQQRRKNDSDNDDDDDDDENWE